MKLNKPTCCNRSIVRAIRATLNTITQDKRYLHPFQLHGAAADVSSSTQTLIRSSLDSALITTSVMVVSKITNNCKKTSSSLLINCSYFELNNTKGFVISHIAIYFIAHFNSFILDHSISIKQSNVVRPIKQCQQNMVWREGRI